MMATADAAILPSRAGDDNRGLAVLRSAAAASSPIASNFISANGPCAAGSPNHTLRATGCKASRNCSEGVQNPSIHLGDSPTVKGPLVWMARSTSCDGCPARHTVRPSPAYLTNSGSPSYDHPTKGSPPVRIGGDRWRPFAHHHTTAEVQCDTNAGCTAGASRLPPNEMVSRRTLQGPPQRGDINDASPAYL